MSDFSDAPSLLANASVAAVNLAQRQIGLPPPPPSVVQQQQRGVWCGRPVGQLADKSETLYQFHPTPTFIVANWQYSRTLSICI
jgi:hypothetical protein